MRWSGLAQSIAVVRAPLLLLSASLVLLACVSDDVIVDTKGVDEAQYERDKVECQAYAEQVKPGEKMLERAGAGAVVGAVLGAAVGDSRTVERAAGAIATTSAARSAGEGEREKKMVLRKCMAGRGYKVLN